MKFDVQLHGADGAKKHVVELELTTSGYRVLFDGLVVNADAALVAPGCVSVLIDGQAFEVHVAPSFDGTVKLQSGLHEFTAEIENPRAWKGRRHTALEAEGRQYVVAPMSGRVIRLLANMGDEVEAGQGIVVVEAMKMQNEIRSPKKGKIERLHVKEGQNVNAGEVLAWID
jgi:biotin carboxyl carrier protein